MCIRARACVWDWMHVCVRARARLTDIAQRLARRWALRYPTATGLQLTSAQWQLFVNYQLLPVGPLFKVEHLMSEDACRECVAAAAHIRTRA